MKYIFLIYIYASEKNEIGQDYIYQHLRVLLKLSFCSFFVLGLA